MAQSALESRKTPFSIEPFWERATSDPPIRWEKWRIQGKLAILARDNITFDTLLQPKPTHVQLPAEPKNEVAIEDATEQTERDRQIRNNQRKLQWEMNVRKSQKQAFCVVKDHGPYVTRNAFPISTSALERKDDVF